LEKEGLLGRVVISKCGRDKGKLFVIVGFAGEDLMLVCDGKLRLVENPKKKKMKHLRFTDKSLDEIGDNLRSGQKLVNAHVRKAIGGVAQLL